MIPINARVALVAARTVLSAICAEMNLLLPTINMFAEERIASPSAKVASRLKVSVIVNSLCVSLIHLN